MSATVRTDFTLIVDGETMHFDSDYIAHTGEYLASITFPSGETLETARSARDRADRARIAMLFSGGWSAFTGYDPDADGWYAVAVYAQLPA